jgi:putative transposase
VDVTAINQCWAMDFMSDALFNGRRFRTLTMMDVYSRECLSIYAGSKITGDTVVDILDNISYHRGHPERIRVDNGPEFISKALDNYSYQNNIKLEFSRPGKPVDNAHIESFNGSLRDECLNTNWFLSIEDAQSKLEAWRRDYNEFRPHSSLYNMTPSDFARNQLEGLNKPDY